MKPCTVQLTINRGMIITTVKSVDNEMLYVRIEVMLEDGTLITGADSVDPFDDPFFKDSDELAELAHAIEGLTDRPTGILAALRNIQSHVTRNVKRRIR